MTRKMVMGVVSTLVSLAVLTVPAVPRVATGADPDPVTRIRMRDGHVVLQVVGEVNNLPATTQAPLGRSNQFGYVAALEGVGSVFSDPSPANQNEATAMLTFFTEATTTRVTPHGPFAIIVREGTTTIYRNTAPAAFSNPDSFRSGQSVVGSTIQQQAILDTVAKTFTVVNMNTITGTARFELGGDTIRIGRTADMFRTSLTGVLRARDGVPPPTGLFAGSAVGVEPAHGGER